MISTSLRCAMLAALLVVAGCTSPSGEDAGTSIEPTTSTTVEVPISPPESTTTVPPEPEPWPAEMVAACSISDADDCRLPWLETWALDRERAVDRIIDSDWGVGDDNVLHGPGGLAIDLDGCPGDWDPLAGVSDDQIRLALISPESGVLGPGPSYGVPAYVEMVNASGGIGGRQVLVEVFDDSYLPRETANHIDQLVRDGDWFAITTIGSPSLAASAEALEVACIPHPLVLTGGTEGIAGHRPFTIGWQMAHATEIELVIRYVADTWTESAHPRVGALVMDNEFGIGALTATEAALDSLLPEAELIIVLHDPAAPVLTTEVASLLESDPDVFLALTAGNPCLLAIQDVGATIDQPGLRFLLSPCHNPNAFLIPAGTAADGWLGLQTGPEGLHQLPRGSDSTGSWVETMFREARLDSNRGASIDGWHWAWHYVELLRIADALPGGLTRPNLLLAAWSADLRPPLNWPGIRFTLNGPADPHPVETGRLVSYSAPDESWHELLTVTSE